MISLGATARKISVVLSFILFVLLTLGCNQNTSTIEEMELKSTTKAIKSFVHTVERENGIYLYSTSGEKSYLILNNMHVLQGQAASYISSIQTQMDRHTLKIYVDEDYLTDYSDKRLGKLRIFKLNTNKEYDKIQIYKNGTEITLNSVGG